MTSATRKGLNVKILTDPSCSDADVIRSKVMLYEVEDLTLKEDYPENNTPHVLGRKFFWQYRDGTVEW